jgi:ribonuclease P/MRP protein subunit POP5
VKHLPKYLRQRWRYLAVTAETWPDAAIERGEFQRHLWYAAQNLLGDAGSAEVDLSVVRFGTGAAGFEAIVRTRRGESDRARAVLACLDSVAGDPVGLRVAGVSGTVRACEEKYMRGGPEGTEQSHVAFEGRERTVETRGGRVDVRVDDAFVGATTLDI